MLYDDSNNNYPSIRKITDYVGATKTVTINSGADFTLAADDSVKIFVTAPGTTAPTVEEVRAEMDSNSTQLAAIVEDTGETLPLKIDNLNDVSIEEIGDEVEAVLDDMDIVDQAALDYGLATLADQVNDEVVDALNVDEYSEPGQEDPPATASLVTKIGYLFKAWRNPKTVASGVFSLYNDAGDTVDQKNTMTDDGTTFTDGKIEGGP